MVVVPRPKGTRAEGVRCGWRTALEVRLCWTSRILEKCLSSVLHMLLFSILVMIQKEISL